MVNIGFTMQHVHPVAPSHVLTINQVVQYLQWLHAFLLAWSSVAAVDMHIRSSVPNFEIEQG